MKLVEVRTIEVVELLDYNHSLRMRTGLGFSCAWEDSISTVQWSILYSDHRSIDLGLRE